MTMVVRLPKIPIYLALDSLSHFHEPRKDSFTTRQRLQRYIMDEYCCDTVYYSREALESHWTHSISHAWCSRFVMTSLDRTLTILLTPGRCSRHFHSWKALEQHNSYSSNHFPCHHCNESHGFDGCDKRLWRWEMGPEHAPTYCSWCNLHFSSRGART